MRISINYLEIRINNNVDEAILSLNRFMVIVNIFTMKMKSENCYIIEMKILVEIFKKISTKRFYKVVDCLYTQFRRNF